MNKVGMFPIPARPKLVRLRPKLGGAAAGLVLFVLGCLVPGTSAAGGTSCPDKDALGTERTITVDAGVTPRVGRKEFPTTLALADKEIVLTFDDGPWPGTTPAVLDALKRECVDATFFLVGRNAAEHPELVRRELAEGHTVGTHTFSHPLLDRMTPVHAEAEIVRGIAAVDAAAGSAAAQVATRFFRFPGFASSPALLERLVARGIVVFGADVWASDWNRMTPRQELQLLLARLARTRSGILLLHDTKRQTAAMLPSLLRELKKRGYRIVHVVPDSRSVRVAPGVLTLGHSIKSHNP